MVADLCGVTVVWVAQLAGVFGSGETRHSLEAVGILSLQHNANNSIGVTGELIELEAPDRCVCNVMCWFNGRGA